VVGLTDDDIPGPKNPCAGLVSENQALDVANVSRGYGGAVRGKPFEIFERVHHVAGIRAVARRLAGDRDALLDCHAGLRDVQSVSLDTGGLKDLFDLPFVAKTSKGAIVEAPVLPQPPYLVLSLPEILSHFLGALALEQVRGTAEHLTKFIGLERK